MQFKIICYMHPTEDKNSVITMRFVLKGHFLKKQENKANII